MQFGVHWNLASTRPYMKYRIHKRHCTTDHQGYLSRHAVSEFASSVQSGKFLWHNAVFRASRKYVYMVVNDLIKMGMIQYYVDSKLKEGYFVEFTEFDKRLETIAKHWREYFQKKGL